MRQVPLRHEVELDLLFVVDNSPAMAAHRDTLREMVLVECVAE